jgi:hypothetical protein
MGIRVGKGLDGYTAVFGGLRSRAAKADSSTWELEEQRVWLRDMFSAEGNPLGKDQYGAQLEKNLPKITQAVFGAFDVYIDEMAAIRDGLRENGRNYENAEDP